MNPKTVPQNYHFVLPQLRKEFLGTQGEMAQYIPYRLDSGVTPSLILQELKRQPHMAQLAQQLDAGRRLYLLESSDKEQLLLAAEYIGTYHRLVNEHDICYSSEEQEDDAPSVPEDEIWRAGDLNPVQFDFSEKLPYLTITELQRFYNPEEGFGFGAQMFRPDMTPKKRPWWTMSLNAPILISTLIDDESYLGTGNLSQLPRLLEDLNERALVIVLHYQDPQLDSSDWYVPCMTMPDLSFELETEYIHLDAPDLESRYKQDILRQLARQKDAPLSRGTAPLKILSLIQEHRGDIANQTLSKAVSNALLRRKSGGSLTLRDFQYLASIRSGQKLLAAHESKDMELVGQTEIRRQLERIVDSMVFQQRRKAMGLPCSPIHYTFAFLGAPGTGKTSWALWLAREMQRRSLLKDTSSICINAAELKAKYVGHTTGKVKSLFEQYGVIILDEAYSLADGLGDDSFSREALAQLCVELENHASDRLVIFAGYGGAGDTRDNRMLHFLQSNPGINSRVSFKVHFPSFQSGELLEVLRAMLAHERYVLPPEAEGAAEHFFRQRMNRRAFGNCREVRNLADRIKVQIASRLAGDSACTQEAACQVLPRDVDAAIQEILTEYEGLEQDGGRVIGFS